MRTLPEQDDMTPIARLSELHFGYPDTGPVLTGLDLEVAAGDFLGIVGPNGVGKSTLLGLLSGYLTPGAGRVELFGRPIETWKRRELARRVAVVPQSESWSFPFRVSEVVLMGRTPYLSGPLALEGAEDIAAAKRALDAVGLSDLACRPLDHLSGGERQMVLVARALAQEPELLLLDEPTASLDLAHQQQVFRLLTRLNRERSLAIVVVTHDLNLAGLYCGRLAVLHRGRVASDGTPAEILSAPFLSEVYGADLWAAAGPAGAPIVGLEP